VAIFGSKRQRSAPEAGSSAITSLNGVQTTRRSPARIGVTWNLLRRSVLSPRARSPLRQVHAIERSPTFAGVICASGA
jgi:hypothetical protein